MKRKTMLIGLTVLVISLLAVSLASADDLPAPPQGSNLVDADGDGVCDNCGGEPSAYQHGYGQGVQLAGNGPADALGPNFVDENGHGLCDLCGGEPKMNKHGYGQGARFAGNGPGSPLGPNFVDEDGDGVCDHAAEGGEAALRTSYRFHTIFISSSQVTPIL